MQSPCVARCGLNDEEFCMGCFRHIDEIVSWGQASESRQQAIIASLPERRLRFNGQYNQKTISREQWLSAEKRLSSQPTSEPCNQKEN